ncbi:N66 matrix protein-like [Drosophila pseudoobscura]|uniref:N66 matrix protein-like n=1 Tax=Drosophila pseudoobscura pseudoobscura TaxID=46245 RepID=A0A6I8VYR7_DROPS|nr:N66 matrix protein [Drosophila pseudoobscura]
MNQSMEIDFATYAQLTDSMNLLPSEVFYPPAQMGGLPLAGHLDQGNNGPFAQGNVANFGQGNVANFGQGNVANFGQGNVGNFGQGNVANFGQGGTVNDNSFGHQNNMNLPQESLNFGQGHGSPRQIFSNPNPMGFHNDPNIPVGLEDLSDNFRANPNGRMFRQPISPEQYRRMAIMQQRARQMLARNGLHAPNDIPRFSGGDAGITFPVTERHNPNAGPRGSRRRTFW